MTTIDTASPTMVARIARHPMFRLLIAFFFVVGGVFLSSGVGKLIGPHKGGWQSLVVGICVAVIFVGLYALFCRFIERRPVVELALPGAATEFGAGIGTGLLLFSAVVAVIAALGGYSVVGTHGWGVLVPVLGIAIASGFSEEIIFRGWFFRLVEQWLGTWIALILSAVLFGALHLGNQNATLLAGAAITLEAGIMLAAIYIITRRLWAAIGVHAAWNFAQGGIYGIPVSGGAMDGLLVPRISGPDLLTGGAFGAEASLPAIIVATALGIVVLVVARRRGGFVAPFWLRDDAQPANKVLGEVFD
jgi:membrane protease YdiL (CAAX protease family)